MPQAPLTPLQVDRVINMLTKARAGVGIINSLSNRDTLDSPSILLRICFSSPFLHNIINILNLTSTAIHNNITVSPQVFIYLPLSILL